MVNGENNISTAAHVGRKWRLKWVPGVCGVAESPSSGGYKHDGLGLQVRGWVTGQQSVTVKKKLGVRGPNCDIGATRLIRIELGNGKD